MLCQQHKQSQLLRLPTQKIPLLAAGVMRFLCLQVVLIHTNEMKHSKNFLITHVVTESHIC